MAVIDLREFAGEKPLRHPKRLEAPDAQDAVNVQVLRGVLEPLQDVREELQSETGSTPRTLFRTDEPRWLGWPHRQSVASTIFANDEHDRIFFARGDSRRGPRVTDHAMVHTDQGPPYVPRSYRLGVPKPGAPYDYSLEEVEEDEGGKFDRERTYFYLLTLENDYREEGPPSDPLGPVDIPSNHKVSFKLPSAPQSGTFADMNLRQINVYRSDGGPFQFIDRVYLTSDGEPSVSEYTDEVEPDDAQEPLESESYDPPPDDLDGLVTVAGSFLAGFRSNELFFSEVGLAHAWPAEYRHPINYPIVELGTFGQTLVIMTTGSLHVAEGTVPGSMVVDNTGLYQPCVSRESVVEMLGGVVYASHDGLVFVTQDGPQVVTEGLVDQRTWSKFNPSTIKAGRWFHFYVAFYLGDGGVPYGFMFDPRRPEWGFFRFMAPYPEAVFSDPERGRLYLAADRRVYEFNAGERTRFYWRSRPARLDAPQPIGVLRVEADQYPVRVAVRRDGWEQAEVYAQDDRPFRLPGAARGREYEIEIEATSPVHRVTAASSMQEIRHAQ